MPQLERKYLVLNGSVLKIIAMVTMFIDHIGAVILLYLPIYGLVGNAPQDYEKWQFYYNSFRNVGRIAFPIFCFLLVEGFFHTKNIKIYITRLFAFAIISEVPFDYAVSGRFTNQNQNVMWTLLIGLLTITVIDWIVKFSRREEVDFRTLKNQILLGVGLAGTAVIGGGISILLRTDYNYHGVLLIIIFYFFRQNRIMAGIIGYISLITFLYEPFCLPAFVLIQFYNGKRGLTKTRIDFKYLFYAFYPVHLLLLFCVRLLIKI